MAILLTRLGIQTIKLYDFDEVNSHNLANQHFRFQDIGKPKTKAIIEQMKEINPDILVQDCGKYENQPLRGIVFICVDSMELTHAIFKNNQDNLDIKYIINTRIGLTEGQVRTYDWSDTLLRQKALIDSDFKNEEAEMPTSACGTTLGIIPTVYIASTYAIVQMINAITNKSYSNTIIFDSFAVITKTY